MWLRDLARPAELALDWRAGNLYYCNSSQTSLDIAVCSTAHRLCRQLLSAPGAAVTRLAVDPRAGRLFVAVIGAEKTDLVSGLALDPVKQLVFWSDVTSRQLRACTYLGSFCQVVAASGQHRPAGLLLLGSKLFWTVGAAGWLHSPLLTTGVTEER